MLLGITTDELVHMKLPEKTQEQLFDEEVYRLHAQGLKYPDIAKALSAPYATVKAIGERRYRSSLGYTSGRRYWCYFDMAQGTGFNEYAL